MNDVKIMDLQRIRHMWKKGLTHNMLIIRGALSKQVSYSFLNTNKLLSVKITAMLQMYSCTGQFTYS